MWRLIIAFLNFAVAVMYFVLAATSDGWYAVAAVLWMIAGFIWVTAFAISER